MATALPQREIWHIGINTPPRTFATANIIKISINVSPETKIGIRSAIEHEMATCQGDQAHVMAKGSITTHKLAKENCRRNFSIDRDPP